MADPGGGATFYYLSDSRCALPGLDTDALFGGNIEGIELKALLDKEGNDQGFTGDFSTLKDAGKVPAPGPYTCSHSPEGKYTDDGEIVCKQFYVGNCSCFDLYISDS